MSPEISEYFLAGKNDGGGFREESVGKGCQIDIHESIQTYLHVTAFSGQGSIFSVCNICFRPFQTFFFPPGCGRSKVDFLKHGCESSDILEYFSSQVFSILSANQ